MPSLTRSQHKRDTISFGYQRTYKIGYVLARLPVPHRYVQPFFTRNGEVVATDTHTPNVISPRARGVDVGGISLMKGSRPGRI